MRGTAVARVARGVAQGAVVALATSAVLASAGCRGAGVEDEMSGGPSTSVPSPPPPFEMAAQRRATSAYPDAEHMPSGWIQADPARLGTKPGDPVYCGAAVKPDPMNGGMTHLYQHSDAGPFILQYTYITSESVAADTMTRLEVAAKACIAEGSDGDGKVFPPASPPRVGQSSVSVAFLPEGSVPSQVTVFREGRALVVLVGWNPAGLPPTDPLAAMAAGVRARLLSTQ